MAEVREWRRLVVEVAMADKTGTWPFEAPLACVLDHLTSLALPVDRLGQLDHLARIVAVCEVQVGDGWQADPSRGDLRAFNAEFSVLYLLSGLTKSLPHPPDRWRVVGDRAAAWLRDLTERGGEFGDLDRHPDPCPGGEPGVPCEDGGTDLASLPTSPPEVLEQTWRKWQGLAVYWRRRAVRSERALARLEQHARAVRESSEDRGLIEGSPPRNFLL